MKKNKIAGLLVASALFVGAGATHSSVDHTVKNNKHVNNKNNINKTLLSAPSQTITKNAMVVNGNGNLVLRNNPNSDSQVVSNISVGEMLKIKSYTSNWYKVSVEETGATGYISASNLRYIVSSINAPFTDLNNNGHVINVSSALNLRSEATMSSDIIETLKNGTSFKILGKQGEWFKINVNGTVGFVYGGYVAIGSQITSSTKKPVKVIQKVAKSNNSSVENTESVKKPIKTEISKVEANKTESIQNKDIKKSQEQKTPISLIALPQNMTTATSNKKSEIITEQDSNKVIVDNTANKTDNTAIDSTSNKPLVNKPVINKHEVIKSELTNSQNEKHETTKPQAVKPETTKPEVSKPQAVKPETTKPEVSKPQAAKPETTKPEVSKPQAVKPETTKPEVSTGSLTLTIYQTNTDQPLKNTSININGNAYITNAQGKIKLTDLSAGGHNFSISSKGFNPTSVISNVKAGKNMNKLIYITKTVENIVPSKPTVTKPSNNNNNNNIENNTHVNKTQLQQDIVNYAENFLGKPYVWGATGPNAFDCSGLTYYVYKHFGYYIGRTTYTQIDKGTPVSLNNLQPGDLIFWGDPSAPYHVAIYIGNGQYIQAPKPGESVDISSWNLNNISAARRII